MDELQKLYDVLVRDGYYTKSFDDFQVQFQDPGYQDKVYGVVERDGLFTKGRDAFAQKYVSEPVKKKEESSVPLWLQKQEQPKPEPTLPFLESKPSGISLGSQRVPETAPMFEAPPMRTPEEAQAIVEAPEDLSKATESEQGWLLNAVSSLDRGFYKNLIGNPVKGMGTLLEGATSKVFGGTGKGPISDALISFGNYYNNAIDELAPQDEDFKNSLSDQFGQAFGQVASLIMTGGIAGAGKQGAAVATAAPTGIVGAAGAAGKQIASSLASPTAISGGLSMGQAEFDRAKQMGATDDQAYEIFYKNAAVGSVLEQIPVMQFLKRFNQSTAGGVANYIKTKGVAGLTGGFEEMTTEVLQQLYANKSAQEVYNINQEILEGVGESGGVGFGVGFLLNAMGARAKMLKKEGKPQEAQAIETQIEQFESKPQGPTPTYSVNGIKIESPEVINQMIENMDVTDLSNSNIEITNDPELSTKLQDKMVTSSIKEEVRSANPDLDEDTLDQITALEKERKKFEGKKTQSAKDKLASINLQIKTLQENAVQKPSTEESVLRAEESQVGLQEVGEGDAKEQAVTQEVVKETESKIKRRDLFDGVGAFSSQLGGSDVDAVPVSHSENNGIELVQYANPKTGSVDVIVTGTSENDFVGFYRIYENGKPTNKWSSKFENQSRNKENFKTMIGGVQAILPEGHEYTEKTSISTDGLRVWNQQLDRGYEIQYDQNGNPITNEVAINGDAIVNELGIDVKPGTFDNIRVTTNEQFDKVKNALVPYLTKMGLNESNIKWENGTVKIDLPVLRKSSQDVQEEVVTPDAEVQAAFDRLEIPEDVETLPGIDDELNKINESIGRVKEEGNTRDDERTLMDLGDKIARAKRNVASAEDTEAAIEELRQAQKERDDFEQSIEKRKNFNTVDALISEEIYQKDRDKETYEYQELFDQDPRLAALQSAKDMAEFAKENNRGDDRVKTYENNIKILEEDIAKFPVKKAEVVSPATPVVEAKPKVSSKTPKAKSVPIPVAIPKPTPATPVVKEQAVATPKVAKTKAVAPVKEEVAPVKEAAPAPTTKAVGPVALQEEYTNKIAEVRLNNDKSRTPKQIDQRVEELQAEYKKLKAEMAAPKPKAKVEAKPKAEAKPAPAKVVSKKDQQEIKALEEEIGYQDRQIEDAIEEIGNTKYNLKEALAEIKKKRDELKGKKMSKEERQEAKDELEAEINEAKEEHDTYLEQYNDQLAEAKKEKKKAETKLAKLQAKQAEPVSVVQEEEPSYDDIKDLDVSDPTFLEIVEGFLDDMDDGLSEFGRGNLSSGMAIPLAKAIIKSLKVLVKAGITLQEAIKRVAAENNLEAKDIVNMIKELDSAQSPMVKLKAQIKAEIEAVKIAGREVNAATQAIVNYFNFNAERGNLTRRDLGRVINVIAKVKDQKSLDKAADKIFEIIDKAKTDVIEVSQSKALVSQIKLEARAALNAKKDVNQKRKDLSNVIKEMETTGKISTAKAQTLLNKISKVNLDNPASVDSFLDYVENVFENAAYEAELVDIKSKLAKMKANIKKVKVGSDEVLIPLLNRLASINPSFIPAESFESYKELVDMLGASTAVLDLTKNISEITEQTKSILDQVDNQLSVIPELTTKLFDYDKAVLTEDGALDYSKTLDKMEEDKVIDEDEKALMKKYKSYIMPKVMKIPKTEQELAAEKKVLIDEIKKTSPSIAKSLASDLEKLDAEELIKLSKTSAAEMLTNKELEDLLGIFNNIENGFYSSYANQLLVKLRSNKRGNILAKALEKIEIPSVINQKAKIMDRGKALYDRMEKGYLYYIDEMLNNFKTKDIYDSTLEPLAQGADPYKINVDRINKQLQDAKNKIVKHFNRKPNKFIESMRKMAIYRMEREWIQNPDLRDSKVVNPAIDYINATVDAKKTKYGKRDKENLMKIAEEYGIKNSEGKIVNINMEKLYNSFSAPEKSALELFDKINKSLEDKASFATDITRGNKVYFHNGYNHLGVLSTDPNDADPIQEFQNRFNGTNIVSTKGKSLIERTGGAKPVDFDIFSTVQRGAKFVLMDYYMTNPVRETRRTIKVAREVMKKDGKLNEDADQLLDMIEEATENALQSMLSQSLIRDMPIDKAMKSVARAGVTSMLASTDKFAKEIISNTTWILLYGRKEWMRGANVMKKEKPEDTLALAEASDSTTMSRVFGANPLGLKLIDPDLLYNQTGVSDDQLKGSFGNTMATIYNYSLRPTQNTAVATASAILSTPDKWMMQPLWRGAYDTAFEAITGQKIDMGKVKSNDVDYLLKNKDAMRAAARQADSVAAAAGTVDNPFMKSLRAFTPENRSPMVKFLRRYNSFLTNFSVGEFLSARRGIHAAMGNGMISKEQGKWLLAATIARMASYQALAGLSLMGLYNMFTGEDDEDDDKSILQKTGQALANTFTTLMMGTEGNLLRSAASWGIEKANEEYGDILREGEYDPYEDAIQYTFMAPSSKGKKLDFLDVIINTSGPYSPVLKTTNLAIKKMNEEPKKEASAIKRSEDELMIRLPLEVIGNTGFLPFYKDIRNIVNKSIYKELDKEMKENESKEEEFKPMGLDKSDLKRYYPEIYEQYYGEGTEEAANRKLEREKNILEQRIKDDYYNYVPKQNIKPSSERRSTNRSAERRSINRRSTRD
jgi:hypothetical protein